MPLVELPAFADFFLSLQRVQVIFITVHPKENIDN